MTAHNGKELKSFFGDNTSDAKSLTELLRMLQTNTQTSGVLPVNATVPMLTLRHNSLRNASMDVCGVEIFFDQDGVGKTPSHNREYVTQYQNLRQGFITIVSDETVLPAHVEDEENNKSDLPIFESVQSPVRDVDLEEDEAEDVEEVDLPKRGRPKKK